MGSSSELGSPSPIKSSNASAKFWVYAKRSFCVSEDELFLNIISSVNSFSKPANSASIFSSAKIKILSKKRKNFKAIIYIHNFSSFDFCTRLGGPASILLLGLDETGSSIVLLAVNRKCSSFSCLCWE